MSVWELRLGLGAIFISESDLNPTINCRLSALTHVYAVISYLFRIFPKKVELQALMKHYDVDGDGNITYEEFIRGLR